MGDKTKIQWTDASWNPTIGCTRVSEGCRNCYAEHQAARNVHLNSESDYAKTIRFRDGKPLPRWNGHVVRIPSRLMQPLKWTKPRMIFVNSMSDIFHDQIPFEFIAAVFGVMAASRQHTFQVLTKRSDRMREFFDWLVSGDQGSVARPGQICAHFATKLMEDDRLQQRMSVVAQSNVRWPLSNVWLGVSVEDQSTADKRIPTLLSCPAAVKWVSYEPALGPVRFDRVARSMTAQGGKEPVAFINALNGDGTTASGLSVPDALGKLDWIVVGGESGRHARDCDGLWLFDTVNDCSRYDVPCFVKQIGANAWIDCSTCEGTGQVLGYSDGKPRPCVACNKTGNLFYRVKHPKGGDIVEWPAVLKVRDWPKSFIEKDRT